MKLLLCLTDLPPERLMKKHSVLDITDRLVDIHVQFSKTRFAWQLEYVLSRPSLFRPTLEDKFVHEYGLRVSELKGNNAVNDTRLQVLLLAVESLLEDFDVAVYLPQKDKGILAKEVIGTSNLPKIRDEEGLAKWLE